MKHSSEVESRTRDGAHLDAPRLARAGVLDTIAIVGGVLVPLVAVGVVARRKHMVRLAGRLDTDRRAARTLAHLRSKYRADAVRLAFPRAVVVALTPTAVTVTLDGTPEPFTPASREKRAALSRFQPTGVLISNASHRAIRRPLNERVLETGSDLHTLAPRFSVVVEAEIAHLLDEISDGLLTWDDFAIAHWRAVRRLVFGDNARNDHEITDLLTSLRRDANWSYAYPHHRSRYERFRTRLDGLVDDAPDDSLAGVVAASTTLGDDADPTGQIPHWLFAFDAVAAATYRALALLAAHPDVAACARTEIREQDAGGSSVLPTLRGSVLESLRLWPTTPAILREATQDVLWDGGVIPHGATTVIISQYFHRDPDAIESADRFMPREWTSGRLQEVAGVVPFSDGAGECPGRNVVMLFSSLMLATLIRHFDVHDNILSPQVGNAESDMPWALDHFDLKVTLSRSDGARIVPS